MKLHILLTFFFLPSLIFTPPVSCQSHFFNWYCIPDYGNYTTNSTYQRNLNVIFPYLIDQASISSFGHYSKIDDGIDDEVYVLYNCRGDLDGDECHGCVQDAAQTILEQCPEEMEAIVWFEECMLRYANRNIFSLEEESPFVWDDKGNVSNRAAESRPGIMKNVNQIIDNLNSQNETVRDNAIALDDPITFSQVLAKKIDDLIQQAAYNKTSRGYAIGEANVMRLESFDYVYSLVQCTPDILGSRCERCLRAVFRSMAGCCGTNKQMMDFYVPSCHIRYGPEPFIPGTGPPPASLSKPVSPALGRSTSTTIQSDGNIFIFVIVVAVNMLFIVPISF